MKRKTNFILEIFFAFDSLSLYCHNDDVYEKHTNQIFIGNKTLQQTIYSIRQLINSLLILN